MRKWITIPEAAQRIGVDADWLEAELTAADFPMRDDPDTDDPPRVHSRDVDLWNPQITLAQAEAATGKHRDNLRTYCASGRLVGVKLYAWTVRLHDLLALCATLEPAGKKVSA